MVFVYIAELLAFDGFVVGSIEEAVLVPRSPCELGPFDMVGEEFASGDVHDVDFHPVGAAALNQVSIIFAIVRL